VLDGTILTGRFHVEHLNSWLIPILVAGGAGLGLSILGKLMPRERLAGILIKAMVGIAVALHFALLRFFPPKSTDDLEEGVFCTLSYAIRCALIAFESKLRELTGISAIEQKTEAK